jgi:DNA polymerase I-like protein with 3'-5' exonuclease and polymerase domains
MEIYKDFEKIHNNEKGFSEIVNSVRAAECVIHFTIEKNMLSSISILNDAFYFIRINKPDFGDVISFLKLLTTNERLILYDYENVFRFFMNAAEENPLKFKFFDIKILHYYVERGLHVNQGLEPYRELNLQRNAFLVSHPHTNPVDIPLNIEIDYHWHICSLTKATYVANCYILKENKTYEKIVYLHDSIYIPLCRTLCWMNRSGFLLNVHELKKTKFSSTHTKKVAKNILGQVGANWMLYPKYEITSSSTGRLSSRGEINYCAIPNAIKSYIIPTTSNHMVIDIDYKSIDVRSALYLAKLDGKLDFDMDIDIYSSLCRVMYGIKESEKNFNELRDKVKNNLLSILYANDVDIAIEKAFDRKKWDATYLSDVVNYLTDVYLKSKKNGYIKNLVGFTRAVDEKSKRGSVVNFYVQPISNMIALRALCEVDKYFRDNKLEHTILLFEHDSMLVSFKKGVVGAMQTDLGAIEDIMIFQAPREIFKNNDVLFPTTFKQKR